MGYSCNALMRASKKGSLWAFIKQILLHKVKREGRETQRGFPHPLKNMEENQVFHQVWMNSKFWYKSISFGLICTRSRSKQNDVNLEIDSDPGLKSGKIGRKSLPLPMVFFVLFWFLKVNIGVVCCVCSKVWRPYPKLGRSIFLFRIYHVSKCHVCECETHKADLFSPVHYIDLKCAHHFRSRIHIE